MSIVETFLPEFDQEMRGTRSIIELVPDRLLDWQAHETLHTVGWVASHLTDTLSWTGAILADTTFDVAPVDGPAHQSPVFSSAEEILSAFDQNLATAREAISSASDEQLMVPWSLLQGGNVLFTLPRIAVLKTFLINHVVHHRAFLVAYLRMNDVECPGLYD
jgi:uncharacterized damage-inducible protein DinB